MKYPIPHYIDIVKKINSFSELKENWDSYGALPPMEPARSRAITFLNDVQNICALPLVRIAPSAIGGIGITFRNESRKVYVEVRNDGNIYALLSDDNLEDMDVIQLGHNKDDSIRHIQWYLKFSNLTDEEYLASMGLRTVAIKSTEI